MHNGDVRGVGEFPNCYFDKNKIKMEPLKLANLQLQ